MAPSRAACAVEQLLNREVGELACLDGESALDGPIGSESPIRATHTLIAHNADILAFEIPPVNRISSGDILLELVVLYLLLHGQSVTKELFVFALGPIGELVMAYLVMSSGVPGPLLNKCFSALPVRESEGELVAIDVRLAEVGAVLHELLHVAVFDLLIDEGSRLLGKGLDLLCSRLVALLWLIRRLLTRFGLGLLGGINWSLLWLLLLWLFFWLLLWLQLWLLFWFFLWLFWLFWLFWLGFFWLGLFGLGGLLLLGISSFWLRCWFGSDFLWLSRSRWLGLGRCLFASLFTFGRGLRVIPTTIHALWIFDEGAQVEVFIGLKVVVGVVDILAFVIVGSLIMMSVA